MINSRALLLGTTIGYEVETRSQAQAWYYWFNDDQNVILAPKAAPDQLAMFCCGTLLLKSNSEVSKFERAVCTE